MGIPAEPDPHEAVRSNRDDRGMSVFISYARGDDEPFVSRLVGHLMSKGLDVWFDRHSMPSRSLAFMEEIRRAIDAADRLLVVLGPAGISSDYVRSEWQYALARGKAVTPVVRLGGYSSLPPELSSLHCPDARPGRPEKESLAEIARVLSEPVPPLGELWGLPSLPPHFRPRPDDASALIARLLGDQASPSPAEEWRRVTVVCGMGGTGKSVLTVSSARSASVRRVFTDGIWWVDARDIPDPAGLADFVLRQVRSSGITSASPEISDLPAEERLRRSLRDRRCLIVLDNAGDGRQVATLARCLDATGRLLVTTRDAHLVDDAVVLPLEGLSVDAGRRLLEDWIGAPAPQAPSDYLVRRCEGLPFALALCGAMAAQDLPLELIAERVAAADLGFLERRFPDYPYPSLLPMLDASLGVLRARSGQAAGLFPTFSVFRDSAWVPAETVGRFWQRRADLSEARTAQFLSLMHGLSLIRIENRRGQREVQLHQLVHDYVTALVDDAAALHQDLLDTYGVRPGIDLANGPDDGYYHANLIHHLMRAGHTDTAVSTLTGSAAWLRSKQHASGRRGVFADDVDLVLGTLGSVSGNPALHTLVRLRTARHVSQHGSSAWGRSILEAMIAVGNEADALASIRATADPLLKLNQLLEIADGMRRAGRPAPELLNEARAARDAERDPARRRRMDEVLTRFAVMNDDLVSATEAWTAWQDGGGKDEAGIGLVLVTRLLREGAVDVGLVAERSPQAAPLVGLHLALQAGDYAEIRRRLAGFPSGNDGVVVRHQAVALLVEAGRLGWAREVARTLGEDQRVMALVIIPEEGALQEALEVARGLPPGLRRAVSLLSCATAFGRLPAAVPDQRRARRFWHRSRIQAPDVTGRPAIDSAELMRESRQEADGAPPFERGLILGLHAGEALRRKDPQAAHLVQAWRSAIDADPELAHRPERLGELALALAHAGDTGAAKAMLSDATAAAETAEAADNAESARVAVARAFVASGHFQAALDLTLAIDDHERRKQAFRVLAEVCADKGLSDETAVLAGYATEEPASGDFAVAHARALARRGQVDGALEAAEGLTEVGRARALSAISVAFADAGLLTAARQAAELLPLSPPYRYYRVAACCALARATAPLADHEAREWLDRASQDMPDPPELAFSLAWTARATALAAVDPGEAAAAFREAIDAARTVEEPALSLGGLVGPTARWQAIEAVGKALADNGFPGEALTLARSVEDVDPSGHALKASIIGHTAARVQRDEGHAEDLFAEASQHAAAIMNIYIGTNWYLVASSTVTTSLCEAGNWQEGLAAIDRIHPSLDVYLAVLARCCDPRFPQFTLAHLTSAMRIVGWVRADWRQLAAAGN